MITQDILYEKRTAIRIMFNIKPPCIQNIVNCQKSHATSTFRLRVLDAAIDMPVDGHEMCFYGK